MCWILFENKKKNVIYLDIFNIMYLNLTKTIKFVVTRSIKYAGKSFTIQSNLIIIICVTE